MKKQTENGGGLKGMILFCTAMLVVVR